MNIQAKWNCLTTFLIVCLALASCSFIKKSSNETVGVKFSPSKNQIHREAATNPRLIANTGHTNQISCTAVSPDRKLLATGSYDKTVKLWDFESGQELRTLGHHDDGVLDLAFSPDGTLLVSACYGGSIRAWNPLSGEFFDISKQGPKEGSWWSAPKIAFSDDGGKLFYMSGYSAGVTTYDVRTRKLIREVEADGARGRWTIDRSSMKSAGIDDSGTLMITDMATGKRLKTLAQNRGDGRNASICISHSGLIVAVGAFIEDEKAPAVCELWNCKSGKLARTLKLSSDSEVTSICFSPDDKKILVTQFGGENRPSLLNCFDVGSGKLLYKTECSRKLGGKEEFPIDDPLALFYPSGEYIITCHTDGVTRLRNAATGQVERQFGTENKNDPENVYPNPITGLTAQTQNVFGLGSSSYLRKSLLLSDNEKLLSFFEGNGSLSVWNLQSGQMNSVVVGTLPIAPIAVSASGTQVLTVSEWILDNIGQHQANFSLVDLTQGEKKDLGNLDRGNFEDCLRFAKQLISNKNFALIDPNLPSRAFESKSERVALLFNSELEKRALADHSMVSDRSEDFFPLADIAFSSSGKLIAKAKATSDHLISITDIVAGRDLKELRYDLKQDAEHVDARPLRVSFGPGDDTLFAGYDNGEIICWNTRTAKKKYKLAGHQGEIEALSVTSDGSLLFSKGADSAIRVWDLKNQKEVVALFSFGENEWACVCPDGRFDCSPGGAKQLHWVVGKQVIELSQLKQRYYEPGLLPKLFGFSEEPLRNISSFENPQLFPEIVISDFPTAETPTIRIKLQNQGGGIGQIQVFVNGKEWISDARPRECSSESAEANMQIDLAAAPIIAGQDNTIRIRAFNADGYLASRDIKVAYRSAAPRAVSRPSLYAVVVGVSNYSSSALKLQFADKDASDFAHALELAGNRLFGPERVHVRLLSSDNDSEQNRPTKANLSAFFNQAKDAKPEDILVVYLAGHGMTLKQGSDTYCYLTQEAYTADLTDPAIIAATTVTSEELANWAKTMPMLKQVMILDTCRAGAAAARLTDMRSVSGEQIRAIERLNDRTGLHILMGCASDSVSYEASPYKQGLLTHALLQGIKGAALREDQFVDVDKLFQYAADEVPRLARTIRAGGIQKPCIAAPKGTSFDIGMVNQEDKQSIAISTPHPLLLRPVFINVEQQADDLDFVVALRKELWEGENSSSRSFVYIDSDELPGAIRPSGTYTVSGDNVLLTVTLRKDGKKLAIFRVVGKKNEVGALATKAAQSISATLSSAKVER